jgi:hypothetical protein
VSSTEIVLADMGSARPLTEEEIRQLLPDVSVAPGKTDVTFNRAGTGFAPRADGIPAGAAAGIGVDLPLPRRDSRPMEEARVLEGFLVIAPGSFTHDEYVSGLGFEVCLWVEGSEVRCSPVDDVEARFLHLPIRDLDGNGVLGIRVVVMAGAALDEAEIPSQPLALLEHLRAR